MSRPPVLAACLALLALTIAAACAAAPAADTSTPPLPLVEKVDAQPLLAQARRVVEAMDYLGSPLSNETKAALEKAAQETDPAVVVREVQEALDPYCLLAVGAGPLSGVKIMRGPARPELDEHGWRQFLVKVYNADGATRQMIATSPNAKPVANASPHSCRTAGSISRRSTARR